MIIKARVPFVKERCFYEHFSQAGAWSHQCPRWPGVAWVTSHWPHMETYGNSSHEPKHQEGPISLRPWEGWCHSGNIPLVINFLKPGTWVPHSWDPSGPLGAHPAVWGPTLPSEVPPSPLRIHLSNWGHLGQGGY